ASLAARHGDPEAAERHVQRMLAAPWIETRDTWYTALLRAYIAARRGDRHSAAQSTAKAFAAAAALGYPQLPFVREREITEELLAIVAGDEQFAGAAHDSFPVMIG